VTIPYRIGWARWVIILWGLLIFAWLGQEDNHVWPVAVLGAGTMTLTTGVWVQSHYAGHSLSPMMMPVWSTILGASIGLGAAVITAFLMLFKNVRHAHLVPDYPAGLMGAVLGLMPVWMLAGAFLGVGVGLLMMAWNHKG
jgi:hypothetical protein